MREVGRLACGATRKRLSYLDIDWETQDAVFPLDIYEKAFQNQIEAWAVKLGESPGDILG